MAADPEAAALAEELRRVMAEPHIERPDELGVGDSSSCFIDQNRMCDSDCRAYDPGAASGPEVCTLLGAAMDIAEGISAFVDANQLIRKVSQDRARAQAQTGPVPDPFGKKT